MSNAMKYIRDLEAAGFQRTQAEAQVQVLLDAMEGDLVNKSDFLLLQERIDHKFIQNEQLIHGIIRDSEFRITTRLGLLTVSSLSVAVALLTWLIKI